MKTPLPPHELRVRRAARELWLARGYAASMSAVAAHAGVSRQTVYSRFGTKDELFRQVIDELVAPVTGQLDLRHEEDLRGSLVRFASVHVGFLASPESVAQRRRLIAEFERFPAASRSAYAAITEAVCRRLAGLLEQWMDRGKLQREDPAELAELLLAMVNGMEPNRQLFDLGQRNDARQRERWIARAVDTFLMRWAAMPAPVQSASPPGTSP